MRASSPSADQVGAVFAAYPLATVIATPFVPCVLRALGMCRAIPAGLCVTALGSLRFLLKARLCESHAFAAGSQKCGRAGAAFRRRLCA